MQSFDPSSASPWRLRVQIVLAWFGLVDDPRERRSGDDRKPLQDEPTRPSTEWARIVFALGVPLWAADRVEGWWYAAFVALAAPAGVIEIVRWLTKSRRRGRIDTVASFLQFGPMAGLLVFLFLGDDVGGGAALAYGAAFMAVLLGGLWAAIIWLARGAEPTTDRH